MSVCYVRLQRVNDFADIIALNILTAANHVFLKFCIALSMSELLFELRTSFFV